MSANLKFTCLKLGKIKNTFSITDRVLGEMNYGVCLNIEYKVKILHKQNI